MPAECIVWPDMALVPGQGVQVELLDLAVLEERGQADSVVGEMLFLANDSYVVLAGAGVELEELFSWWLSETGASASCEAAASEAGLHEGDPDHTQAHNNNLFPGTSCHGSEFAVGSRSAICVWALIRLLRACEGASAQGVWVSVMT